VFQPGDHLRFGLEALDEFRLAGVFWSDDLDSHIAANGRMPGAIDGAVSAGTDFVFYFIVV
jgi:hypothetical protein